MAMNESIEEIPDEKAMRIRRAVHNALMDNESTNQGAFDALTVNLVALLRTYPLEMREVHFDMVVSRIVQAAFAEIITEDKNEHPKVQH